MPDMGIRLGNIYVTREKLDPDQQRMLEQRFTPHLQRGGVQIYASPDAWTRAVIISPFSVQAREHPEDRFIKRVLKEELHLAFDELY